MSADDSKSKSFTESSDSQTRQADSASGTGNLFQDEVLGHRDDLLKRLKSFEALNKQFREDIEQDRKLACSPTERIEGGKQAAPSLGIESAREVTSYGDVKVALNKDNEFAEFTRWSETDTRTASLPGVDIVVKRNGQTSVEWQDESVASILQGAKPEPFVVFAYPDKSTITLDPDGTKLMALADGTTVLRDNSGITLTSFPNDLTITERSDGSRVIDLPGGGKIDLPAQTGVKSNAQSDSVAIAATVDTSLYLQLLNGLQAIGTAVVRALELPASKGNADLSELVGELKRQVSSVRDAVPPVLRAPELSLEDLLHLKKTIGAPEQVDSKTISLPYGITIRIPLPGDGSGTKAMPDTTSRIASDQSLKIDASKSEAGIAGSIDAQTMRDLLKHPEQCGYAVKTDVNGRPSTIVDTQGQAIDIAYDTVGGVRKLTFADRSAVIVNSDGRVSILDHSQQDEPADWKKIRSMLEDKTIERGFGVGCCMNIHEPLNTATWDGNLDSLIIRPTRPIDIGLGDTSSIDSVIPRDKEPIDWTKLGKLLREKPIDNGFDCPQQGCMVDHKVPRNEWEFTVSDLKYRPPRLDEVGTGDTSAIDSVRTRDKQSIDWKKLGEMLREKPIDNGFDCIRGGCMVDHKVPRSEWEFTVSDLKYRPRRLDDEGARNTGSIDASFRTDVPAIKVPAESAGFTGDVGANLDRDLPSIPVSPVSDMAVVRTPELELERDNAGRLELIKSGDQKILVKYDGDKNVPSGFELRGKDGSLLARYKGRFEIDEKTGVITVTERDKSDEGLARIQTRYFPNGDLERNEYNALGLRTKQCFTSRAEDGTLKTLTTNYSYLPANAASIEDINSVRSTQTDEKGRVTETAQFNSVAAVESGKPFISEQVKYSSDGAWQRESRIVIGRSDQDQPKVLAKAKKEVDHKTGATILTSEIDANGTPVKQEIRFNSDGKPTSFTKEIGKDKYSYDIDSYTGKLVGVKLDGQAISDQFRAKQLIAVGQSSVELAAIQNQVRSAVDASRQQFLNPESNASARAQALAQLKERAATGSSEERAALQKVLGAYEGIAAGLNVLSASGFELAGETAQKRIMSRSDKIAPERLKVLADDTVKALEALARTANSVPPNEHAKTIFDSLRDQTKTPPKDAGIRLSELLTHLKSGDPKLQQAALFEIQNKLAFASQQLMNDATRERVFAGKTSNSSLSELSKDQPDLARLARGGDKDAERMLVWMDAMKTVADGRLVTEKPVTGLEIRKDSQGRPTEITKDGLTTRLSYKDGSTEPSAATLYDRFGNKVSEAEGLVRINARTGEVTVTQYANAKPGLAKVEYVYAPGGRVDKNEYSDTGLRIKQTATIVKLDEANKSTVQTNTHTVYEYAAIGPGGRQVPTDNPLTVRLAVAVTKDSTGQPIAIRNFNNFAGVELDRSTTTQLIERSARVDGRQSEVISFVDTANPDESLVLGQVRRTVNHNTGERELIEESNLDKTSQNVKFDASGTVTAFTRNKGEDSYSYQLKDGKIESVVKNGQALSGAELDKLRKEGEQVLAIVANNTGVKSYRSEVTQVLLDGAATPESRQQALKDLDALLKRSSGSERESLSAEIERLKAGNQSRAVLESLKSADRTVVSEHVSEKGRELVAKDSQGSEVFSIRFGTDGKPDLVREKGGNYWNSVDGGKTWTAYEDKDLKVVAKDKFGKPQTWSGEVSLVDGNLVQKWVDGSRISIRQPDGTRIWEYPKELSTGIEKVEIERPDKSTVTIKTSDSGREIVAKDARGEESYTVKFGPDGKPNFSHSKDGCEWLSSDGGKTWIAHKDRKPIENEDGTYYTWKGEVTVDSNFSLREMGKSGHLWIRSPDGSKTTRNPEDKATGSQRTDIQKADKTSVTVTTSSNGEETVARDSKGEETYRFRTGPDGKPSYVHEVGGYHWRSSDGGKTWVAYDRAPTSGSQPDTGKPVDANGRPVDDLSKAWVWKGSVSVDQNYSLLSIDNTGKVSCRRTGGLQLKWNRTDADQTELSPAEHKVVRDFKVLTELSVGPPPSQSANELLEKLGGKLAVQSLLRRLQVNEPGVREAAIKEMSAVLNPATAHAVARDQILNAVAGINKDSTAAELARIQPELLGLARAGNPQAERWLNWSEAAKNLDSLRQREPAPVAAGVRVVTDANGRPSEIRTGDFVTAKLEYSGESKVPSSIELRVPDPASPGKFKSDIIEPNGPVRVDTRSGVISFSRPGGDAASLERSDTKIYPNGTVERDVYDANGLRTERRSRELGKPEAELLTSYTYIDRSGRVTENPAAVAMVMAESRNANKEVVRRENFNGFAAVELNKPAMREAIETRVESNNRKVELHTYTDVSNPAAPKRVGESQRTEDAKKGEVTISGSLVSGGKPTSESAKFKANGEAVSFSRQVGDTKFDYVLKDGRVINVKVANPEKLALDVKNAETINALIDEGNSLLSRMRDQYNIRSADNPESAKLTKKNVLDEIARNTNPASGTLVLVNTEGWEGGRYQSFTIDAGKILGPDGKQLGTLKNNGDAEFADGRKLNVLATEGAMFSGRIGDGSNAIHFNMAKPQRDELNGVIRYSEAGSEKTYRVVNGMVFNGEKFLGHLSPGGRFHFNAADVKQPSLAVLYFPNARFEGTDNSNPPQERVASLNDDAPNGKIVIPDEKGRAIEYDVRLGMIINKTTREQIGVLTPPTMHGDSSLSGGAITLMDGRTVPLGNFRGAAFSLGKPSSQFRGIAEKDIEGLSLGPQERLADGSINPETGGLYSVTQARDASELRLKQSIEKLREYDDGTHPYDYFTGVRESTVRQLKNAVRLNQRDGATFATSFQNLLNGKYSDESVDYVLATLNIARLSTGRENISIKKQQLESAPSEFESLPNDTTTINGRVLLPTINGGNVSGMQEFKIVNGELIGRDGKPIGKIENSIDPKTGQVTQGVLNMLDPRDPSNSIRGMGALTGAVWNLEMPNQYGQLQRVSWVSLGAMNEGQKSLGTGGLISARELARQVSTEIKIAKANLEAGGKTEKSQKAFAEIARKATEYQSKLESIANRGIGSVKDLEVLLDGAKKQIRGDRADEKKDAHKLKRAELPDNMMGVEGRLRLNDQVLQIKDGKLYRAGENSPVGELKPGYQVEFLNGEKVDLTRQPRVLLQWRGTDGQTHNLIGLGPGAATQNFGYLAGGLVDVKQLKEQARDAISAAARQDRKYFADRPWLTGGAGNWLTETTALSWITGKPLKGGVEGVMKEFQQTLLRFERELDQQVKLYFGRGSGDDGYGGFHDVTTVPDGFNEVLIKEGTYSKDGQPGNLANVGLESLDMRAGAIQTLMVTMGTTADKHAEIAQEMAGFQQQVASSLETAVVTVATAGAGTYFAAAANAGKMGRGASVMWQLGAGAGFGGIASGISMSDSSHGFGHVSSGVIKGLAMSAPGMLRTWRGVSGAAQLGEAAVKTEVVAASGLSKVLPTFAQYGGKALTTVKDNVPAMLADSAFQSTMFAAADWAKSGYDREKFLEHFDPQKLAIGTGAMFFAQVVGHGFGRATDAVGAKVGQKIAGTEAGQAFLQSRTGQVLLGAEIDQVTKRAVLGAIKQGEQSLIGSVSNQMSNAYAFGFTGNLAQSIEAEKSRVAEKLGFMKRDKQGNLVPDTSMVSTDGSMFSWATVIRESHEAGLHAAADAGPMAVGTHYLTKLLTKKFDKPGKGSSSDESKRVDVEADNLGVPVQADRTFEVGGQRVAIGRGQEVELSVSRTKGGEPNGKVLLGQDSDGVYLKDLGTDGVWIRREGESKGFERVGADGEPVRVNPGDEVRLGSENGELLKLHEEQLRKPDGDANNLSPAPREPDQAGADLPQRRAAGVDDAAIRAPASHEKSAIVEISKVELNDRVVESVKKTLGEEGGAKVLGELKSAKERNADLPIPFDTLPEMTKEQIELVVRKVNEIEQINRKLEGKNHSDVVEGKSVADILRERALLLRDLSEPRVRVIEVRQQADLVREFTDKIKSNSAKLETFERLVKQFPDGSPERAVALKLLEHSAALLSTEGLGAHMKELRRQISDDMLSEKIIPGGPKKVVTIYTLDGASEGNMLAHIFAKNNPDIRVEIFSLKGAEFSLLQQALSNRQQNVEAAQKRFDKLDAAAQSHRERIARGEATPDEPVLDAKGNRIAPHQAELESKLKSARDELSALSALRLDPSWSKGAQDKFKSLGGANRVRNALIFDDLSKLPAGDPRRQFLEKVPGLMIADVGGFVRGVSVTDVALEPSATGHPAEAKVKSLVGDIQRHPAYKEYQLHLQEAVREPAKLLELQAKADAALKRAIDETLRPDESRPDGILDRNKNARKLSAPDLDAARESLLSKIGKGESERLSALHDRAAAPLLTEQGIRDYLAFVGKEVQRVNLKLIALGEPPLRHTPEEYQSAALAALRYGANIGDFATMFTQTRKALEGIMETAGLKPDQKDKLVVIGSLESTKSDERAGSSYAMQHMLAKAGGLNEKNFVSIDDLNALVKTSEQRSLLKELQAYKVNTPEDRAKLEFELREGKYAALRAKLQDSPLGRQLKDKTVVVMDDYFNSGKQQAENIADNKALLQALGVTELIVASLGRHELPAHRDPLVTADFGTLTLRHVNAEKYPLTFKPGQHELLDHYRNLIEDMGIFSNYTDGGSDVRTAIFTPYGQPNNNARVIAALEQFMSGPRRFEGGVKLFGTEYHVNGKAESAALFEQMSQAGKVYSFTGKDGKHVEAFFVANGKLSLKQDKGGVAHGPAFLIKHEDGSFSVASGKDFLKVYAGGSDARSQRRYELLKGYYEEASRRTENLTVDQAKPPDMRRAASIDVQDAISPRIVAPDRTDASAVPRGANDNSGRMASRTGQLVQGEDFLLVKEVKSPAGSEEVGRKVTVVSGESGSKRFVQVDGKEHILERRKQDVWYFGKLPKGGGVPDSPLKVYVDAVNAEELKSLQTLLFKALEHDPALSKMVVAWKTMDPRYGHGEELAFGVRPGRKGQNAKAFTIYANSPEEARQIAKVIDDIIVNAGQRRKTGRIDHENVEEFVGLSNRVTVTREQFERSSSSSVQQSLVRLDKAIQEKVCEQYGVKSPKDLSSEQLRDIENKSGVLINLLEVDKDGQLALRVTGNPKDPTKERMIGKDKLYVPEGIDGKDGKTDRKALFALSASFGVDPLKVADSAVRSAASDKGVMEQPKGGVGERDAIRAAESERGSPQRRAVERRAEPDTVVDGESVSKVGARPKEFELAKSSAADREAMAKEGRISKLVTKESIESVARSMVEITDGWAADLSLQARKTDDAFVVHRAAVAEYESKVKANLVGKLPSDKLSNTEVVRRYLEKKGDQLGLAILDRYESARDTFVLANVALMSELEPRRKEVENYFNEQLRARGLPSVEIVLCKPEELGGAYGQYAAGKIYLLRDDLLSARRTADLVKAALHEAGHVDHERQVLALIADELNIGKTATAEQLDQLRITYLERCGYDVKSYSDGLLLSKRFLAEIIEQKNGVRLSDAERQRAENLSRDWFKWSRELASPFHETRDSLRVVDSMVARFRDPGWVRPARDLIEQLSEPTGQALAKRLFGRSLDDADFPWEVTSLINMYKSWKGSGNPDWNEGAARSLLEDVLTSRLNHLNKSVNAVHNDYLTLAHEVESHVLGNEAAEQVAAILQRRGIVSTGNGDPLPLEPRPNRTDATAAMIGRPAALEPLRPSTTFGAKNAPMVFGMSPSVDLLVGNVVVNVLPGQEQVLGRSHQRDLPLQVSRTHAFVGRDSEGTYIREDSVKPSSHGTFILMGGKGEAIRLPVSKPGEPDFKFRLQPGDVVILGGEAGLRFEIPAGDQVAPRVEVGKYRHAQEHSPASALVSEALLCGGKVRIVGEWSGGNSAHEKYTAKVTGGDGRSVTAIFRPTDTNELAAERFRKENAAQHLSRLIGLDNGYPASVEQVVEVDGRARRGWLQDSTGRTLEDPGFQTGALRELAVKRYGEPSSSEKVSLLIREDAHLRDQFEQAALERMILGDDDDNGLNRKIVVGKDGKIRIQNFDLDFGFQLDPTPMWGSGQHTAGVQKRLIKDFAEQPISAKNLDRLRVFLDRFDTESGRKELLNTGLKQQEVIAVLARARWFLTEGQGKFPRTMSMMEMIERASRMKK